MNEFIKLYLDMLKKCFTNNKHIKMFIALINPLTFIVLFIIYLEKHKEKRLWE
jgi:hypothetical protein